MSSNWPYEEQDIYWATISKDSLSITYNLNKSFAPLSPGDYYKIFGDQISLIRGFFKQTEWEFIIYYATVPVSAKFVFLLDK